MNRDARIMYIKKDETDGLYGFGSGARENKCTRKRRNTHVLSFFAAALCTAVLAVMVAVLPIIGPAVASPLLNQVENGPHDLGVAAIAAFSFSTIVCAAMLMIPVLASRKSRRKNRL